MKTVQEQMASAREAQRRIKDYTQEEIDDVCLAIAWEVYEDANVARLAEMAVEETGFGNVESKILKHKRKIGGTLHDIRGAKSVGLIERNEEDGISKYAKPVGVVCAILPATNPTATCGCKAISILKGRNAVIFKASSRAMHCTKVAVEMMRAGLRRIGAPEDLIQVLEDNSRDAVGELMRLSDLIVATGSKKVVRAAYSSGTPAYGVGQGNACVIVAEDADIEQAASMICSSKVFDFATSCSSENAVIVIKDVYAHFMEEMGKHGCWLVTMTARERLMNHMWTKDTTDTAVLNPNVIAQSARAIAEGAGINVPPETDILLVEGREPIRDDMFHNEKISPVLTVYEASDFMDAYRILTELTSLVGRGHSCGIHTYRRDYIEYLGEHMESSRITVRQPMSAGNGGHFFNRMPSTATLGCGTWGGNITTENVHWKHFINVTWVNEPVSPWHLTDEDIWGTFWERHGK